MNHVNQELRLFDVDKMVLCGEKKKKTVKCKF